MSRQGRDPDFAGFEAAMLRAAKQARIIAAVTDTPLVLWEDGRVVHKRISLTEARRLQRELREELSAPPPRPD
jgi:hypothetical protein